jgi:hypothetical protein
VRLRLITLIAVLWACHPEVSRADAVLYTVSADYSGLEGLGSQSTLNWSFEVPSIISGPGFTEVTTILNSALGPGFGNCGAVTKSFVNPTGKQTGPELASFVSETEAEWATLCGPGNDIGGAGQFYYQPLTQLGTYTAYSYAGVSLGTLTIAAELNLQGGPSTSPTLLDVPLVAVITGTIGAQSPEDYYSFFWAGGAFNATGSITGPTNTGASYLFSEGVAGSCSSGGGATLNGNDNFSATIAFTNLVAGQYCIGIDANNINDPTFAINFNTPVAGVPEPSGCVLLSAGLGILSRLRGRLTAPPAP